MVPQLSRSCVGESSVSGRFVLIDKFMTLNANLGRFFMEKAQAIAEVLAKLSSHERKRRQVYRSEVHGQLPFDPRGMDEPAPTLEISTSGGEELAIGVERQDIAGELRDIRIESRSDRNLLQPFSISFLKSRRLQT